MPHKQGEKAPSKSKARASRERPLTARERRFASEYAKDQNATRAARRAGYTGNSLKTMACNLYARPEIRAACDAACAEMMDRVKVDAERILNEYALLAFSDIVEYLQLHDDGLAVLDWSELPPGASKVIQEITQEEYVEGKGHRAKRVRKTKFKLYDKTKALEKLGEYLRLWDDKRSDPRKDELNQPAVPDEPVSEAEEDTALETLARSERAGGTHGGNVSRPT